MKNNLLSFFLLTILFSVGIYFNNNSIISSGEEYKKIRTKYAETLDFQGRLLNAKEWLNGKRVWKKKDEKASNLLIKSEKYKDTALNHAYIFIGGALIYILLSLILYSKSNLQSKVFSLTLIISALACLYTGIFTPMLEISAFKENLTVPIKAKVPIVGSVNFSKTFDGKMFFYYQSKSIMELINLLFKTKNYVVGACILFFSVLIPLIKLIFSFAVLLEARLIRIGVIRFVIEKIGKWSMADVFVVACFLSYLSFQNMSGSISTDSSTLIGLYFFIAYCILSIFSAQVITSHKLIKK